MDVRTSDLCPDACKSFTRHISACLQAAFEQQNTLRAAILEHVMTKQSLVNALKITAKQAVEMKQLQRQKQALEQANDQHARVGLLYLDNFFVSAGAAVPA